MDKDLIRGILANRIRLLISQDFRRMEEEFMEDHSVLIDTHDLEHAYYLSQTDNINKCIEQMISEYEQDGELDDLLHPEDSWIREYLNLELPPNKVNITLEDMAEFMNQKKV
jgi:hypothetical protein